MDVRAVGDDLYMQLSTWEKPLAGCWLRTGPGQVPGGQLAMTPGVPGYVTLLGALQPGVVVSQDGDNVVVGADVPLRVGLQLLTTGVLGLLQLDASQLDGASVPVGIRLTAGVLTDVELKGADLVGAVRAAGGAVPPEAEATVGQLRISLNYRPGNAERAQGDGTGRRPGHDQRRREGPARLLVRLVERQNRCSPVTRASTTSHTPLSVSPAMVMNLSNVTPESMSSPVQG